MFDGVDFHVGCEIVIRKGDAILLGKRKNCYGAGTWGLPGGHLGANETLAEAMCREVKEELGATISGADLRLVSVVDSIEKERGKQAIQMSFELINPNFEPLLMEPDRCEEWRYFDIKELPLDNFFEPHQQILENYFNNVIYNI